jgi:4'-phosphopantetheinyl transferase
VRFPTAVGADIEHIEPRPWRFVEDYFTADEIDQVRAAPAGLQDTLVTAIWSGKEAVLKALRVGLTVDTRAVSCFFQEPSGAWEAADAETVPTDRTGGWIPFQIRKAPQPEDDRPNDGRMAVWTGWWRTMEGSVLTLAVLRDE